jgi:general secretion pathway protein B
MSYILEALRKSQQDREIGQVPTLATQPLFTSQESGRNAWGLAAMALAGLAVAIALYAALRGGPEVALPATPLASPVTQPAGAAPVGAPVVTSPPGTSPALAAIPATTTPAPAAAPMAVSPGLSATASPPPRGCSSGSRRPPSRYLWPAQPTPPPVRSAAREDEELANRGIEESDGAPEGMNEGDGMASRPADGIPDDLRQDIQSFKEQLKGGQGGKAAKKANNQKPLPPQERRLPREVEERLPSFLLTVHIYDAEPAKRFVMIDGRKLRQGDASRGGILVEEILPDGVALSFEGHQFFRPR